MPASKYSDIKGFVLGVQEFLVREETNNLIQLKFSILSTINASNKEGIPKRA